MLRWLCAVLVPVFASVMLATTSAGDFSGWKHSGSLFVLTTPDGADLPAAAVVEDFPLLVRLHADFFDFSQARPDGADLRFATDKGDPLAYQIEEWEPDRGEASVWVRMPRIEGNARQPLRLFWGKADAAPASDGKSVFNASNGYASVWHMHEPVTDAVGTLDAKDTGTTPVAGVIGQARHFPGRQGIFCGTEITSYPTGSEPHTTQAWLRPEKPNGVVIGWGNEQAQGKVTMLFRSPPHVAMDCYFSAGSVVGQTDLGMERWVHVAHTYRDGDTRLYVNGVLDTKGPAAGPPLNIRRPARLWLGGWYNNYSFVGDLDEVRVSNVVRSPEWLRLEYENQRPLQTLVGPVITAGDEFSVSTARLDVDEGGDATVTARAGGAQKVFWVVDRGGHETVVATDRLRHTFAAGRVTGDESLTLRCRAIYPDGVKTRDIAVRIREAIPEPVFTLKAPATWDGRTPIEVVPQVTNLDALRAAGGGELRIAWDVAEIATIRETRADRLALVRAFKSGTLTVTARIDNGGPSSIGTATIAVTEPAQDAWVPRTPAPDEQPEENQFYARDDKNVGTVHYNGRLTAPADSVFLKLYADDKFVGVTEQKPAADGAYALSAQLKPGLVRYAVEFGTRTGGRETVVRKVGNLVCGDAFLFNGQSNTVATDFGKENPTFQSDWIRSFGSMSGNPQPAVGWGNAVHRSRDAEKLQIGYWGMELARRLVESQQVPICIINGAVGGTRIDQHQRNEADPTDTTTIYGRLLWRVRKAGLTHGIRGVLWHQGENDQGADGPTGGYGWETYRRYFIDLAAAWKQDYPNVRHFHMFQIWPKACAMGINGSDNRLREVQRSLPDAFANLGIMSTLGINPPGGCHFPAAGYAEFARLIEPLVARDHYGKIPTSSITPPNLRRASIAGSAGDEIVLEFDQPVVWNASHESQFSLDGVKGQVVSGTAAGSRVTLKLASACTARTISYVDGAAWSQAALLRGANGIAALSFCDVPLLPRAP